MERAAIGALAMQLTEEARARYGLHQRVRHRLRTYLGGGGGLNLKLTAWWTLPFPAFRAELLKVFRHDIPLRERDDWEAYLDTQHAVHARHTAAIVALETRLNTHVADLFGLAEAERAVVEASTKYEMGSCNPSTTDG